MLLRLARFFSSMLDLTFEARDLLREPHDLLEETGDRLIEVDVLLLRFFRPLTLESKIKQIEGGQAK